eukprot:jgi/Picsp_1/6201/NSC_03555-R1_---NA---
MLAETIGAVVGISAVTYATFVTVSYLEVKRKIEEDPGFWVEGSEESGDPSSRSNDRRQPKKKSLDSGGKSRKRTGKK